MKPDFASEKRQEERFTEHMEERSPMGWTLQASTCVRKEGFLAGARAALKDVGVVRVYEIAPEDEGLCITPEMLEKGTVLVRAKRPLDAGKETP